MRAFTSYEVIRGLACFITILTVNITHCRRVSGWHGLHPHSSIEQSKVLSHVFNTLLAKRTCKVLPSHIHAKASHVHHMATLETTKRLCRFKHAVVTNRAGSLQLLRHTTVFIVRQRHTGIASHTVPIIDAKAKAQSTNIAERTVIDIVARERREGEKRS